MFTKKRLVVWLLLIALLTGCSSETLDSAAESAAGVAQSTSSGSSVNVTSNDGGERGSSLSSTAGDDAVISTSRQIIYTAHVTMRIKDYEQSRDDIRELVQLSGGYMLDFEESSNEKERRGSLTVKIPAQGFESFLEQLEELKPLSFQQSVKGQDVTAEYIDFSARLKAKQLVEERLLTFMEQATRSSDLLEFSNELGRVQEAIEQIKGHLRYLEEHVAYSTITIRLTERLDGTSSFSPMFTERINDSFLGSISGISKFLQNLVVFIVWFIPVAVVIGLFVVPVWYMIRMIWRWTNRNRELVMQETLMQEIVQPDEQEREKEQ